MLSSVLVSNISILPATTPVSVYNNDDADNVDQSYMYKRSNDVAKRTLNVYIAYIIGKIKGEKQFWANGYIYFDVFRFCLYFAFYFIYL